MNLYLLDYHHNYITGIIKLENCYHFHDILTMRIILTLILVNLLNICNADWWYLCVVGPYSGTANGVIVNPKDARSKRAQPCENMPFLKDRQKKLCNQGEFIIDVISEGAALAISECLIQFKDRKWNCTTFKSEDVFGNILDLNSREKSLVYSITSAGVAHSITSACARGEIGNCGCDTSVYNVDTQERFQWGGCSHNPRFGSRFAREFIDSKESRDPAGQMNLWNNQAGRMAVEKEMVTLCKCHGVSASCAVKICWRSLPEFKKIGESLKRNYDGATQMRFLKKKKVLRPALKHIARPKKHNLVYLNESPDFCLYNKTIGSLGTVGRQCNRTSPYLDNCGTLCCGRGFTTEIRDVELDCNCRFVWCCKVECDTCRKKQEFNFCK